MNEQQQAAMRQALEALEESLPDVQECLDNNLPHAGYARYDKRIEFYREQIAKHEEAITALRQALEQQPTDEPVAYLHEWVPGASTVGKSLHWKATSPHGDAVSVTPLYTRPSQPLLQSPKA